MGGVDRGRLDIIMYLMDYGKKDKDLLYLAVTKNHTIYVHLTNKTKHSKKTFVIDDLFRLISHCMSNYRD